MHIQLSAMCGIGLFIGMLISWAFIFGLSVDVANAVTTVVSPALAAALMVATFVVAKRARVTWDPRAPQAREQTQA